jgi:hypothetical protein
MDANNISPLVGEHGIGIDRVTGKIIDYFVDVIYQEITRRILDFGVGSLQNRSLTIFSVK